MLIFLYVIVFLLVGVYYAQTAARMRKMTDMMAAMAAEVAAMKAELQESNLPDVRDYELAIQQGVENLMSYGVEVAMKGER